MGVVRSRLAELPAAVGATARLPASTRFVQNRGVSDEEDPPLREQAPVFPRQRRPARRLRRRLAATAPLTLPDPRGVPAGTASAAVATATTTSARTPLYVRSRRGKTTALHERPPMSPPTATVASEVVLQRLSRRPETGKMTAEHRWRPRGLEVPA